MKTLVCTFAAGFLALGLCFAQEGPEKPNKNVDVKVEFPKEMKILPNPVAGGETASFTIKTKIKNNGKVGVGFSSAAVEVKVKGLMVSKMAIFDNLLIEAGKTHEGEREIKLHTVVPEAGKSYEVEVTIFGHKKTGKVAAPK